MCACAGEQIKPEDRRERSADLTKTQNRLAQEFIARIVQRTVAAWQGALSQLSGSANGFWHNRTDWQSQHT
jgi:hypothetical protein